MCEFKGCMNVVHSRGLCGGHYAQQRRGEELRPLQLQFHGLSEIDRFKKWLSVQPDGCWVWLGSAKMRNDRPSKEWHGQWRNVKGEIELTNRAAWRLFVGPIPLDAQVLHRCDVPRCCNPEHLFLGSQADNVRDMWRKARAKPGVSKGSAHGCAKITESDVRAIRASAEKTAALAKTYSLARSTIDSIRQRKTWTHIK